MTVDQYTIKELVVEAGDGHELYSQQWGSPDAKERFVYLHGGPGSGVNDAAKTLFDPNKNQVLFFDQRGCGSSTPYGELANNTTDDLVQDISKVADDYGWDKFAIVGSSWGSCLGLVYAIKHQERLTRMVIGGVFTAAKKEIDFVDLGVMRSHFPDVWERYVETAPAEHAGSPSKFHFPRILSANPDDVRSSAHAYTCLEDSISSLDDRAELPRLDEFDPTPTIIEVHYLANSCFLSEGYVLANASKINVPVDIVQGRYDMITPPETAYELSRQLGQCTLTMTPAGHSQRDRANWQVLRLLVAKKV